MIYPWSARGESQAGRRVDARLRIEGCCAHGTRTAGCPARSCGLRTARRRGAGSGQAWPRGPCLRAHPLSSRPASAPTKHVTEALRLICALARSRGPALRPRAPSPAPRFVCRSPSLKPDRAAAAAHMRPALRLRLADRGRPRGPAGRRRATHLAAAAQRWARQTATRAAAGPPGHHAQSAPAQAAARPALWLQAHL